MTADDRPTELERVANWFDERTGSERYARTVLRKVFPDHWTFLLGEVALFCFVILVATGTFLTFFYTPDARPTTYQGPYVPLAGTETSAAFASVMRLSFEVRAGLLMRQIHHWTALVFLASIGVHMARVFFTGAFRKPREINWAIGIGLLLFALGEGITGYSLPDDLLSGTGLRIIYSGALSIPFIGPWVASLLFGGEFPTPDLISRLFVFHVMLLPGLFIGGIGTHLLLVFVQKHTQYKVGPRRENNVVGLPFWPGQVFRSVGLFFGIAAAVALLAGLIQINPVWLYGPYLPWTVSSPSQPDWYVGWLEGLLRLGPAIEPTIFGITIPTPFLPGVVVPGILFTVLLLWPFIEARITGDHRMHNLLDWPWETPIRTATGAAGIAFLVVVMLAGANDVLGVLLSVSAEAITQVLQILIFVVPVITWLFVWRLAKGRRSRPAGTLESPAGTRLRRNAGGGFEEADRP
ncbi:MAG TPA: cytochrome bc complex cytochrome b subunit [Candidatus Limnocylindrales bacterium]|nr:cytochrome bc complex cytochrome b subunit [Candidatus Limnocylindrales bacterium]